MSYRYLSVSDGEQYFPSSWSLAFKPLADDAFFPEPQHNELLRQCSAFVTSATGSLKVFVCGKSAGVEELLGEKTKEEVFLYGSYNQVNVCQLRVRGIVSRASDSDTNEARELLGRQIRSGTKPNRNSNPITKNEANALIGIVASQPVYCFVPREYAYDTYDRG